MRHCIGVSDAVLYAWVLYAVAMFRRFQNCHSIYNWMCVLVVTDIVWIAILPIYYFKPCISTKISLCLCTIMLYIFHYTCVCFNGRSLTVREILHVDFSILPFFFILSTFILCHCTLPHFVVCVCVRSLWGSSARATIQEENAKFEIISGFFFLLQSLLKMVWWCMSANIHINLHLSTL